VGGLMALDLTPQDIELLVGRIRAAFTGKNPQEELREFVSKSLGFDIFDEITGPLAANRDIAFELVDKTERDGTTDKLVRALFQERKGDAELREFVKRVLPDAIALVPQQDYEAALVAVAQEGVSGLERLRKKPKVARQLSTARVDLDHTSTDLGVLAAYKGLHDALHDLQLRLYPQILDELGRIPDAAAAEALGFHAQDLSTVVARAEDAANTLPDAPLVPPEKNWIANLNQVSLQLSAIAKKPDGATAANVAFSLGHLLRFQPGRLNLLLVQTARRIPWATLIQTLRIAADNLPATDPERQPLVDAGSALDALMKDVLTRVEEHELWQALENNFWQAEEALQRDDGSGAAQVFALWPMLTEQLRAIREKAPGDWTGDLDRYANDFTNACQNPEKTCVTPDARNALQHFVRSGRVRFFNVDRELKTRCQGIMQLSEPLRRLIQP
jgi:hypothetical protein